MISFDVPDDWAVKKLDDCLDEIIDYRGKSTPKDFMAIDLLLRAM